MPSQDRVARVSSGAEGTGIPTMPRARSRCLYRVKVEPRAGGEGRDGLGRALVLHVYQDGVEIEALDFELSPAGARSLFDEVRWFEWKNA